MTVLVSRNPWKLGEGRTKATKGKAERWTLWKVGVPGQIHKLVSVNFI